eukprot:8983908-Pyramimonas_sp.AAC.1
MDVNSPVPTEGGLTRTATSVASTIPVQRVIPEDDETEETTTEQAQQHLDDAVGESYDDFGSAFRSRAMKGKGKGKTSTSSWKRDPKIEKPHPASVHVYLPADPPSHPRRQPHQK